ncbi:MAG TPA: hypothetical protein VJ765_03120 [Chitinophagaceae bacterium]|nr:hypothetical protein [Chitinophagaceae bacterium]
MKSVCQLAFLLFSTALFNLLNAQRIAISEPDRDDSRRMDFEVIGKMGNNYLIYKNIRGENFVCIYDNEMKMTQKIKHQDLPGEKLINVDFFTYPDYIYAIYQYQKRNIIHCAAVKLDGLGKKISDPVELDTTFIGGTSNNKIYTALSSEDKQKIIIFKINTKNKERFLITTNLYNDNLELQKRTILPMAMDERNDHLGEFALDNDGNLVFTKFYRSSNESISNAFVVLKKAMEDSFTYYPLVLQKTYLDELRVKVDNANKRCLLSAFYYTQKRGNIEGLYFLALNRNTWKPELEKSFVFTEDLRQEARGETSAKMVFNDYFIRNIFIKKDGGFLIDAEAYYTTSRSSAWNRWDYMYGSPFFSPYNDYYYSPYYSSWRRYGSSNQSMRYHAENVVLLLFTNNGELEWSNVIRKEQFDDESDDRISYQVMNTGEALHFLFNLQEKKNLLLNDFSLSRDGQITRNPTLRGLDKGHEFLPKYGKQISAKQFIVPCFYRNYICFAKIEFN